MAEETLPRGVVKMSKTWTYSLLHLMASMNSWRSRVVMVRVKSVFSGSVCSSIGQEPLQPSGTSLPQYILSCAPAALHRMAMAMMGTRNRICFMC